MKFLQSACAFSLLFTLAACGGGDSESRFDCTTTIFAASSLSSALTEMTPEFRDVAQCEIALKFGSSGTLAAMISSGAQPGLFLTSGTNALQAADLEPSSARAIVESHLAIVTAKGTDADTTVTTVKDLLETKWKLGLCASSAPCGDLADLVLMNAIDVYGEEFDFSREALADTEAANSSDLLTKLQMGELDVVLGYASSCATNDKLVCRAIPDIVDGRHLGEKSTYYVTALGASEATKKLAEYISSSEFSGRLVADFGFETLS